MHYPEDFTKINRKDKEGNTIKVKCPKAVTDYNKYMGGVDHFDHYKSCMLQYCSKVTEMVGKDLLFPFEVCYYQFVYFVQVYFKTKQKKNPCDTSFFWEKLAKELIGSYCCRTPKTNTSVVGSKVTDRKVINLDVSNAGEHLPIPTTSRRCGR